MRIVQEKLLPIPVVAKILEEESRSRSLSSIELLTLEYCKKLAKLPPDSAERLVQALVGRGIPVEIAVQIANVVPRSEGELRTILAPLSRIFSTEELRSILNLIKELSKT